MPFSHWFRCAGSAGLLLAGLFLTGCNSGTAAPPKAGPPEVAVVTVTSGSVVLSTELPGRTVASLVAEIRPQVNGLIQKRLFQEGANIRQGEVLYQIDPAPYQAAFEQAKASVATAEADLAVAEANLPAIQSRAERLKGLAAIHAVGQQDADDASAALRQAKASIEARRAAIGISRAAMENARINMSYTPIKAPISGRIGKSSITVGSMVAAYQPAPLATIQKLDPIFVDVTQASARLLSLRRNLESGQLRRNGKTQNRVRLILEDGTTYPEEGILQFQDVTVDPATGSVTLRVTFPNSRSVLLPGMFVRAVVEEGRNDQAILVPQQGVSRDTKGRPVALVVNAQGKVEQRVLELDRTIGDKWLVSKGLAVGDRLVVEGMLKVRPGDAVHAVPFAGPSPSASGADSRSTSGQK